MGFYGLSAILCGANISTTSQGDCCNLNRVGLVNDPCNGWSSTFARPVDTVVGVYTEMLELVLIATETGYLYRGRVQEGHVTESAGNRPCISVVGPGLAGPGAGPPLAASGSWPPAAFGLRLFAGARPEVQLRLLDYVSVLTKTCSLQIETTTYRIRPSASPKLR